MHPIKTSAPPRLCVKKNAHLPARSDEPLLGYFLLVLETLQV